MNYFIIILFTLSVSFHVNAQNRILAVFAHPDDETTITPVLAEYAEKGWVIDVVISTDGRYGVTDHYAVEAGSSLINVRKKEIECSCDAIGANPPILLDAHDGMKGLEGVDAQFGQFNYLVKEIGSIIDSIKPDVLITMGPEGDSGHPDHRIVSAVVTQLFFSLAESPNMDLYYCAWSKAQADKYEGWNLYHVADQYLNTRIPYSTTSEEKHFKAIKCYVSQYSKKEMQQWIDLDRKDEVDFIYFRRVLKGGMLTEGF